MQKISIGLSDLLMCSIMAVFSSWTIAYHVVLILRLPVFYLPLFWLGLLFLVGLVFKRCVISINYTKILNSYNVALAIIIGVISLLTLFTLRPDNDDIEFFHRAYLQNFHLGEPIYVHETLLNFEELPPISILHLTTSYEYFTVFISKIIHIDPVIAYQNLMSWIVSIVTLATYYCIFRFFGLEKKTSLIAVLFTSLFFIIDGNVHRSFGNVSFVRLWQGKTILWTTLIPMSMFVSYKFIRTKSFFYFVCLLMISICGVGLSNSGVFLIPVFLGVFAIAYLLTTYILERKLLIENYVLSIWILIGSGYCSLFAGFIILKIFPEQKDNLAWVFGWPANWWDNFLLPFGDLKVLIRSIIIILIAPLIALPLRKSIFLIIFSVSVFIICFNPLTGPFFMSILLPGSYWRLVYLLPIPLCFGFLANIFEKNPKDGMLITKRTIRIIGCIMILAFTISTVEKTTLSPTEVSIKSPFQYKFDSAVLESAENINNVLDGHFNLLVPDDIVTVLPLINPNVRFEAGRTSSVQHYFIEYGLPEEGIKRQNAKAYIETLEPSLVPDFIKSISSGVNAVVVKNANIAPVARNLGMTEGAWSIALIDNRYTVFLKGYIQSGGNNSDFGFPLKFIEEQDEKVVGNVDSVEVYSDNIVLEGWIRTTNKKTTLLLITDQHNRILSNTKNNFDRPDVSEYFNDPNLDNTGWIALVNKKDIDVENSTIRIYYLDDMGNATLFRRDIRIDLSGN